MGAFATVGGGVMFIDVIRRTDSARPVDHLSTAWRRQSPQSRKAIVVKTGLICNQDAKKQNAA